MLKEASVYEASQDIAYLDSVIQESLRLYPPVPRLGEKYSFHQAMVVYIEVKKFNCLCRISRECHETTVIKGVIIPKGAIVMIPTHLLQADPQYWKDPKKFDPDR